MSTNINTNVNTYNHNMNRQADVRAYNLVIGGCVAVGLLVTLVCSYLFTGIMLPLEMTHPVIFSIAYLVLVMVIATASVNSVSPVTAFVLYLCETAVVGAFLSTFIPFLGTRVVAQALICTVITVIGMMCVAMIYPNAFARMGMGLFITLLVSIVIELSAFLLFGNDMPIMDYVVVVIFSLYVGYDWVKGMRYPKQIRYAVITAAELYLDIINLFVRFASILSRSNNNNR